MLKYAGALVLVAQTPVNPLDPVDALKTLGVIGLILYLWDRDRRSREEMHRTSEDRYKELAEDYKKIVVEHTTATTRLADQLATKITNCPYLERAEYQLQMDDAVMDILRERKAAKTGGD